jgi:hypothetical protein
MAHAGGGMTASIRGSHSTRKEVVVS